MRALGLTGLLLCLGGGLGVWLKSDASAGLLLLTGIFGFGLPLGDVFGFVPLRRDHLADTLFTLAQLARWLFYLVLSYLGLAFVVNSYL